MTGILLRWVVGGLVSVGAILGLWAWVTTGAYNRGIKAAEEMHEATLRRMESALTEALKKNEQLTDPEVDCRLKRLRNPSASCQ